METYYQYDKASKGTSRKDKIREQLWQITEFLLFRPSFKFLSAWRIFLLRLFGAKIGCGCYVSNRAIFVKPWNLIIGNHVGIDDCAYIKADVTVKIDDYVSISSFVHILPSGHDIRQRNFELQGRPSHIKQSAFIGTGAFIGPGVTIGQLSVVGSNTSIYKDIPDNTVVSQEISYRLNKRLDDTAFIRYKE